MSCNCASDWRLEILDLASGSRLGWLPFTSFNFEVLLNQAGTGTVVAPVDKVSISDVWPHRRAIAFIRVAGPEASPAAPVCEFIGMIETTSPQSDGSVNLGLLSIESYFAHRVIASGNRVGYQTALCADVVNEVNTSGVPILGVDDGSVTSRTVNVEAESDMTAADFITQVTAYDDGPDYELIYGNDGTGWSTFMHFADYVGSLDTKPLNARRGLSAYGITVDGAQHANWVRGRDQDLAVVEDDDLGDTIYPRFDKAVKYSDIKDNGTNLAAAVSGELANNSDPIAIPDVTIADLDISAPIGIGDSLTLNMDFGALRYQGDARVVGKAWSLTPDSPTLCTLSMVPESSVSDAILNAPPGIGAGCC